MTLHRVGCEHIVTETLRRSGQAQPLQSPDADRAPRMGCSLNEAVPGVGNFRLSYTG